MTKKLCTKCHKVLPISEFGHGAKLKSRCSKCKYEDDKKYNEERRELNGETFHWVRRYDPSRADRLDEFRKKAQAGLPM